MKLKILYVCVLLLCLAFSAFGQTSFLSQASQGVFRNDLDKSFNSIDFSTVDSTYLFGGWSNFKSQDNLDTSTTGTINFGAHGILPFHWSAYAGINHTLGAENTTVRDTSGTVTTVLTDKQFPEDGIMTSHFWREEITDTVYDFARTYTFNDSISTFFSIGRFNLGAYLNYAITENSAPADNYISTETFNQDTAAFGAAPVEATDYTVRTDTNSLDRTTTFKLGIPFAFDNYSFYGQYSLTSRDLSGTNSVTESAHVLSAPATITDTIQDDDLDIRNTHSIYLSTYNRFPAFFKGNPDNNFIVGADLNASLYTRNNDDTEITQVYTNPGKTALGTRYERIVTYQYGMLLPLTVNVSASHSLYYALSDGFTFGIIPGVNFLYSTSYASTLPPLTSSTTIIRQDLGTPNGVFTDVADRITTTTTTYIAVPKTETGTFGVKAMLPAAVKVRIASLPFSFVAGTALECQFAVKNVTKTATVDPINGSFTTSVTVVDGTGAEVSRNSTSANSQPATVTSYMYTEVTHSAATSFGLSVDLPAGATLDILMNNANLLAFENLKFQFTIPLK